VGERPNDPYAARGNPSGPGSNNGVQAPGVPGVLLDDLGVRLMPMPEDTRQRLGLRPVDTGLVITEVTPEGPFDKAGLQRDLVILEANGQPVPTVEAFEKTVRDARAANRSKILLAVRVGQSTTYLTVDLPAG
jgi:serine protease Do